MAYAYLVVGANHTVIPALMSDAPASNSLADWMQFCRDVLSQDIRRELEHEKLGGLGSVVIADETSLEKRVRTVDGELEKPSGY